MTWWTLVLLCSLLGANPGRAQRLRPATAAVPEPGSAGTAPVLRVVREGPLLRLVWEGQPAEGRDPRFELEQSDALGEPGQWQPAQAGHEGDSGPYRFDPAETVARFFRLSPLAPAFPRLAGVTASATKVVLGERLPVRIDLSGDASQVTGVELTIRDRDAARTTWVRPEVLGISGATISGTWQLRADGLGFGTAEVVIRLLGENGWFSEPLSLSFEVVPATTGGTAPVLRAIEPETRSITRPTDILVEERPSVTVRYEDADGDALRVEARSESPGGPVQTLAWEVDEGLEARGDVTLAFGRIDATDAVGTYRLDIRVVDRNANASPWQSASLTVRAQEANVRVDRVEPAFARAGDLVSVWGGGFASTAASNQVLLAGLPLEVLASAPDRLEVRLPEGAVSGRLTVITPEGRASSNDDLQVAVDLRLRLSSAQTGPGGTVWCRAVTGTGDPVGGVVWTVNGTAGGSAADGWISPEGEYTAPPAEAIPTARVVGIGAFATADGELTPETEAWQALTLNPAEPPVGEALIPSDVGGVLRDAADGHRARLEVPPGALAESKVLGMTLLDPTTLQPDAKGWVAGVRMEPDGTRFLKPVRLVLPLEAWHEPGTRLNVLHRPGREGAWQDEGWEAVVDETGFSAAVEVTHFTEFVLVRRAGSIPGEELAPRVDWVEPSRWLEGSRRPVLLEGTNLTAATRIEVLDPARGGAVATGIGIDSRLSIPGQGSRLGFLLASRPDRSLPAGMTRNLVLRLTNPGTLLSAEVPVTLEGLDEFVLAGGTNLVAADPGTTVSRRLFSTISVNGLVRVNARSMEWSSTGPIELFGGAFIDGSGAAGLSSVSRLGGVGRIHTGGTGGSGGSGAPRGQPNRRYPRVSRTHGVVGGTQTTTESVPQWSGGHGDLPLVHFARGAVLAVDALTYPRYGMGGGAGSFSDSGGWPWDDDYYGSPIAIYRGYTEEIPDRNDYDPGDREYFDDLLEATREFLGQHPDGRRGTPGVLDAWLRATAMPNRTAQEESHDDRASSPGHGGGGGGGSGANEDVDGLGGGAGGEGGSAIRLVAGQSFYLGSGVRITTVGGNGGAGARRRGEPVSGGGGGPGSGGTVHLLAGTEFTVAPPARLNLLRTESGRYGDGGFLSLRVAPSPFIRTEWDRPARGTTPTRPAEGEYFVRPGPLPMLSGPEFRETRRDQQTLVSQVRPTTALELEGTPGISVPILEVRVRSPRRGERLLRVGDAGTPANHQRYRVRVLLEPGFNQVELGPPGLDPVLVRDILVIPAADSDGDGLTDLDERVFGLNPVSRDSDGDGQDDAAEWESGTGGNDPDAGYADGGVFGNGIDRDGDGWSDAVEEAIGTLAGDPLSTPRLSTVVARPPVQMVRPGFRSGPSGSPDALGPVVAMPGIVRVLRPGFTSSAAGDGVDALGPVVGLPAVRVLNPGLDPTVAAGGGTFVAQPSRIRIEPR